jgi:thymidylate synthase (FAD)
MYITEPQVYLVGKQVVNDAELDRFLGDEEVSNWKTDTEVGGEKLVEVAGRLCYLSFAKPRPGGNRAYIDHILEAQHGSVIEGCIYNFIFTGISRALTHELIRHRAGMGYSQLSQRFVDETDCDFVVPPALLEEKQIYDKFLFRSELMTEEEYVKFEAFDTWLTLVDNSRKAYKELSDYLYKKYSSIEDKTLRRKRARESARSVLPNACETKIFVTANARALRHFIEMRSHESADQEIRNLAIKVLKVMQVESPNLFGDYEIEDRNGELFVSIKYRKV